MKPNPSQPGALGRCGNGVRWRLQLAQSYRLPRNAGGDPAIEGFTLLESLIAIVILTVTIIAITPPIFWATATRVQNRRAEQASQLAQSEIDRVRAAVERQSVSLAQLPPIAGAELAPDAAAPDNIDETKTRSLVPGCDNDDGMQAANATDAVFIDTDPEPPGSTDPCAPEFLIQTFRGQGVSTFTGIDPNATDGFYMGVRVYSIAAEDAIRDGTAQAEPGRLGLTNGLGTQRTRPLAVLGTPVVRSDDGNGLRIYREICAVVGDACFAAPGS